MDKREFSVDFHVGCTRIEAGTGIALRREDSMR
jgi:hypothetical protein